jgi:hypothetical protein
MGQGKVHGKRIRTSIAIGAAAVALGSGSILGTADSTNAAPLRVAAMTDIPSHHGIYRASMSPSADGWTVEIRTADGAMVDGAAIELEGWMPDDSSVMPVRAAQVASHDQGEYQVAGMKLERTGWWNVRTTIKSERGTDSLAFNVVR